MDIKNIDDKNKAKYTSNMRNFVTSSIVTSVDKQTPNEWSPNKSYIVGDLVQSDSKIYVATQNGNSGSTAPTHSGGIIVIGKIGWLFLENAVASNNVDSNIYLGMGGTKPWIDEKNPPAVDPTDSVMTDLKEDLITLIRLDSSGVRFGLKYIHWIQNVIYDEYDPNLDIDDPLNYKTGFYVITKEYNVYKCIDNSGGQPSVIEPTGRSVATINTTDGYIWKYMASIERSDISRFITKEYVPISVKAYDDGSDQWKVQVNAKNGSIGTFKDIQYNGMFSAPPSYEVIGDGIGCIPVIALNGSGGIERISVFEGGSGYNENTYITIFEDGTTGSGGKIKATLLDGSIDSLEIVDGGTEYAVVPSVFIVGDGTGAEVEVTINSVDGSINNVDIVEAGTDYTYMEIFVVKGENAGVASAILSPSGGHGYNVITELGARSIIFSCRNTPEMAPYLTSGKDSTYRQLSLLSNVKSTKNKQSALLMGTKHPLVKDDQYDKYDVNTGFVLWLDNRTAITRSDQQEEYIKIVLDI